MVLINCKECNKKISDKAKKCPKCGIPINEETKIIIENKEQKKIEDFGKKLIKIGLGLMGIGLIIFSLSFLLLIIYLFIF